MQLKFSQSCHVLHLILLLLLLLLPVEEQYLNNRNSNKHENLHVYIFFCATCCYIFVKPFTSFVTDRYLPQQYIIMHRLIIHYNNIKYIT